MSIGAQRILTREKLLPIRDYDLARLDGVVLPSGVIYLKGQVLGRINTPRANAVHTITLANATGGTFAILFGSDVAAAIPYNATAAQVQAIFDAALGTGNTVVTGTGPYTVTYQLELGGRELAAPTADASGLTSGSTATVTIARTTIGSAGPDSAAAYDSARSDGAQTGTYILARDTRTAWRGAEVRESGADGRSTAEVYYRGEFLCADLVGLNATNAAQLGKVCRGGVVTDPGACLRIL